MAKEIGPYEGGSGAGGKLRRQSGSASARKNATPYDRPLTGRHAPAALRQGNWFAKIVDPASRIIANSAVRFFSSVFKRRLPAPSPCEDDNREVKEDSIQEVPEEAVQNAVVTEAVGQGGDSTHKEKQKSEPELADLEQLVKTKTFSRDEFNRLTQLIQSRIVDSSSGLKEYEEKMREELHGGIEPNNVANAEAQRWREERKKAREEKENSAWHNNSFANASRPAVLLNITDDVGASPADVARAYMGIQPLRSSALALQGRPDRDESTVSRLNGLPLAPRRTANWLAGNGQIEDRYKTPQTSTARSRIQSLSRTAYPRNVHGQASQERVDDGFPGTVASSRWTPLRTPIAGGRQVLKRRSSVLDDGFASVGPIRRTRPKFSSATSSMKCDLSGPNSGQLMPLFSPAYDFGQNALPVSKRTTEMEKQDDGYPVFQAREDATKKYGAGFACVPPQSSETARKILEHLDRMVPSPKEKSAEAQLAIARDKSPSQLTVGMLNAHARRSTENIGASPPFDVHGSSSSPTQTHNQLPAQGIFAARQKYSAKGKAPLMNSAAMPIEVPTSSGIGDGALQSPDSVCVRRDAKSAVLDSLPIVQEKSKGFRMSALEVSQESDDEGHGSRKASLSVHAQTGKFTSIQSDGNGGDVNPLIADKPMQALFGGKNSASTVLTRAETNIVIPASSVALSNFSDSANNISGFTFPVTTASSSFSEPPPTPTPMPSPSNTVNAQPKMGNPPPMYNFGSSTASKGPVFSFPTNGATDVDTSKPKFDFKFESRPETSFSSTAVAAAAAAASTSQGTLGSEPSVSILKGTSSSLSSSTSIFSTSTAVTPPVPGIPSFGGTVCKADGMSSFPFSSPGLSSTATTTPSDNNNLAAPSSIAQGVAPSTASADHLFKSFSNADQNTSKSESEITSSGLSPSPSLFGIANATSSAPSNTTLTSSSASNPLFNSSGSVMGHVTSSAPASLSAPFAFASSASSPFLSSSSPASLFSSSSSVTFGSASSSLFGVTPATSTSSALLGSFGSSASSSFSSVSAPSFGLSSSTFGTSTSQFGSAGALTSVSTNNPSLGSGVISSFGGSSAPSFGLNTTAPEFGSGTSPSFGSNTTAQFGSSTSPSFVLSTAAQSAQFGSSTSPSFGSSSVPQFGSSTSPSFGSGVTFGLNATSSSFASSSTPSFAPSSTPSFGSGSSPSFTSGSAGLFGSGSSPSFGVASSSFGSGSTPSFGGSSASFGSGSTPSFGGSSASFGLGSAPSFGAGSAAFGSGSTPSFGLAQSFGASSVTSSSQTTTPSFGSGFGGTPSLPTAGFSFGGSVAASSAAFQFGASGSTSSGSTFSFAASTGASPSAFTFASKDSSPMPQQSMFGLTNSTPFGVPPSPAANDQMNMEDSMAEDTTQVSAPPHSVFGQSASSTSSAFLFGSQSSAASTGQPVFQFGAQPAAANSNPFVAGAQTTFTPAGGGLEFSGGGFSLGTGGEKSNRKFIKAKRDKSRRK